MIGSAHIEDAAKRGFEANSIQRELVNMGRLYDSISIAAEAISAQLIGKHHDNVGHLRFTVLRMNYIGLTTVTDDHYSLVSSLCKAHLLMMISLPGRFSVKTSALPFN